MENSEDKLIKLLEGFTENVNSIKDEVISDANSNLGKIENEEHRLFLKDSLKNAINGNLNAEDFIAQFKDLK